MANKNNENNAKNSGQFKTDVILNKDSIKYSNRFSKSRFIKKNSNMEKIFSQKLNKNNINKNADN
jgi:hypothetical protein